jgi:predicted amidophosphoribosyltransferase
LASFAELLIILGLGSVIVFSTLAILLYPLRRANSVHRASQRLAAGHCPRCDYDLRGSQQSTHCPECGLPFYWNVKWH